MLIGPIPVNSDPPQLSSPRLDILHQYIFRVTMGRVFASMKPYPSEHNPSICSEDAKHVEPGPSSIRFPELSRSYCLYVERSGWSWNRKYVFFLIILLSFNLISREALTLTHFLYSTRYFWKEDEVKSDDISISITTINSVDHR